jgi:hypothetical protein
MSKRRVVYELIAMMLVIPQSREEKWSTVQTQMTKIYTSCFIYLQNPSMKPQQAYITKRSS